MIPIDTLASLGATRLPSEIRWLQEPAWRYTAEHSTNKDLPGGEQIGPEPRVEEMHTLVLRLADQYQSTMDARPSRGAFFCH
jgi:hypothetical protein